MAWEHWRLWVPTPLEQGWLRRGLRGYCWGRFELCDYFVLSSVHHPGRPAPCGLGPPPYPCLWNCVFSVCPQGHVLCPWGCRPILGFIGLLRWLALELLQVGVSVLSVGLCSCFEHSRFLAR